MKLKISILLLLLVTSFAFAQIPEDVNGIKKVCYTDKLQGDWLVHRIHGTTDYNIFLNAKLINNDKARKKASNEAYLAYVKMRKILLTKKPKLI